MGDQLTRKAVLVSGENADPNQLSERLALYDESGVALDLAHSDPTVIRIKPNNSQVHDKYFGFTEESPEEDYGDYGAYVYFGDDPASWQGFDAYANGYGSYAEIAVQGVASGYLPLVDLFQAELGNEATMYPGMVSLITGYATGAEKDALLNTDGLSINGTIQENLSLLAASGFFHANKDFTSFATLQQAAGLALGSPGHFAQFKSDGTLNDEKIVTVQDLTADENWLGHYAIIGPADISGPVFYAGQDSDGTAGFGVIAPAEDDPGNAVYAYANAVESTISLAHGDNYAELGAAGYLLLADDDGQAVFWADGTLNDNPIITLQPSLTMPGWAAQQGVGIPGDNTIAIATSSTEYIAMYGPDVFGEAAYDVYNDTREGYLSPSVIGVYDSDADVSAEFRADGTLNYEAIVTIKQDQTAGGTAPYDYIQVADAIELGRVGGVNLDMRNTRNGFANFPGGAYNFDSGSFEAITDDGVVSAGISVLATHQGATVVGRNAAMYVADTSLDSSAILNGAGNASLFGSAASLGFGLSPTTGSLDVVFKRTGVKTLLFDDGFGHMASLLLRSADNSLHKLVVGNDGSLSTISA